MKKIIILITLGITIVVANSHSLNQCGKQYNTCTEASTDGTAIENDKLGMRHHRRGNYGAAIVYHKKACSLGYASGCNHVGYMYDQGEGVHQNYKAARKYFTLACDYHNSTGCLNLGTLYKKGQGVSQNDEKAKIYYQKSCSLGSQEGCHSLHILNRYLMLTH